ncbi:MAG: hypothetical protein QM785_01430 [Pyrinomonadaceae bacterium]
MKAFERMWDTRCLKSPRPLGAISALFLIVFASLFVFRWSAELQTIGHKQERVDQPDIVSISSRQAVVTTGLNQAANSNRLVVFSDPFVSPGSQTLVSGLPSDALPQSLSYYGSDNALVGDGLNSRIFVIQVSSASVVSTINTAAVGYEGTGTIAVSPNLSAALAMGTFNATDSKLYVIRAPFNSSSAVTSITLPGKIASGQTQAIVFNRRGVRLFITLPVYRSLMLHIRR